MLAGGPACLQARMSLHDDARACACARPHRDLEDGEAVRQHLAGCTALLHLAGYYRWWSRDPSVFERVNHLATKRLMEAALGAGVRKVRGLDPKQASRKLNLGLPYPSIYIYLAGVCLCVAPATQCYSRAPHEDGGGGGSM